MKMQKSRQRQALPGARPKKKYRKQTPLTEEEKEKRKARLAKARAAKGPAEHKSVHPDVCRDESSPVNIKSVRMWIKSNQERLAAARQNLKLNPKDRSISAEVGMLDTYVHNMNAYLRSGVWSDWRWGENQEGRIRRVCKVMAYHWQPQDPYLGMIKREVDVIYPDCGLWTQEMNDDYYDRAPAVKSSPVKKTRKSAGRKSLNEEKRRTKKPNEEKRRMKKPK